jgi:hypothetical protein
MISTTIGTDFARLRWHPHFQPSCREAFSLVRFTPHSDRPQAPATHHTHFPCTRRTVADRTNVAAKFLVQYCGHTVRLFGPYGLEGGRGSELGAVGASEGGFWCSFCFLVFFFRFQ